MANINQICRKFGIATLLIGLSVGMSAPLNAATTDLASEPLASTSTPVPPNILFTLDDSGSMKWDFLPDYAGGRTYGNTNATHCKGTSGAIDCNVGNNYDKPGLTPFQTNEYNGMAYNPRFTYQLPVNADGTDKPSQGSPWTAVKKDGYGVQSTGTINLTNGYPEVMYGVSSGCTLTSTSNPCKRNGIDTNNPFLLRPTVSDNPAEYAFPGTLSSNGTVQGSPLNNGPMNQGSTTLDTVFIGMLNIDTAGFSKKTLSNVSVNRVGSSQTVIVTYSPYVPALVSGDTVKISGSNCSSGYLSGKNSRPITVIDATHFSYDSNSGTSWNKTSCKVQAYRAGNTAVAPMISKAGSTVTVTLSSPLVPLVNGSAITVASGAGICDAGYIPDPGQAMTVTGSKTFTYSASTPVGTDTDTTCTITQGRVVVPASPGIISSGSNVTIYINNHGLNSGDSIRVTNGSGGTCDNAYTNAGDSVTITKINSNSFSYSPPSGSTKTNSNCKIEKILPGTVASYKSASTVNSNPYYFVMIPTEYCDSIYLTNCKAATGPVTVSGVAYSYPAPVRYCKNDATAEYPPGDARAQQSGTTINCQAKYSAGMESVRYGLFWRGDIKSSTTTYGQEYFSGAITGNNWPSGLNYSNKLVIDRSARSDCAAAPSCTYAEEMTNFANWYAYYRTRMQMMKSSAGRAFNPIDDRYRVGFVTINENSSKYLSMGDFNGTQKTNWYAKLYATNPSGGTPLRRALANAGQYFAGKHPGVFTGDPMEYTCQQNFEILTTDGYWNGSNSSVLELDGTTMGNHDNVDSGASKRGDGVYDGGLGASNTLADVALYYYKTDLRNSALGNCTLTNGNACLVNDVPMTIKDTDAGLAGTQHMKTFSLGLADGLMTYQSNYESALTGDFAKIKNAATGCTFSGSGTCNWPLPVGDSQTALDDLWHAAVNGRGTYYNARDPGSLASGLSSALAGINVRLAAAAASATSSPNITQTDRSVYSSTFRTTKWDGEMVARLIDPVTGLVEPTIIWSAQAQLDALIQNDVSSSINSRQIYTFDSANANGNQIKDFMYGSLTLSEKAYFDNKCAFVFLRQCTTATLTATEILHGNSGLNMVEYLRGNQSLEAAGVYRARDHFLGDTVNAKPAYIKYPQYSFNDAGYAAFKSNEIANDRQGVLYIGSNDGMLHAFNSDTGEEMWSYVPKIVMPNLYKLAEKNYATLHQYYVDGSHEPMDVYDATLGEWRSILIGGLGLGGRGYYALDVTDPLNPIALWEICSDSTLCGISDVDMGYSYGNPVIVKRSSDQKWVVLVTSGYNNVSPGSGEGIMYVLDAITGAVLNKTSTGGGTAATPSGLAKLSPYVDSLATNNTARFVYGGDLNGDVWRFDLGAVGAAGSPTVLKIASLKDDAGVAQPITTRPELGDPLSNVSNSLGGTGNPALFIATGRYLGFSDRTNTQIQSAYGIKDDLSKTGLTSPVVYYGNPRTYAGTRGSFIKQYIYEPNGTTRTTSHYPVSWTTNSGWYVDFVVNNQANNLPVSPPPSPGERVNIDPQLISGTLVVSTNVPVTSSACSVGGVSWLYSFNFLNGQNVETSPDQVVGQKVPGNAITVGIVSIRLPGGQLKAITTVASGDIVTLTVNTQGAGATRRASWRELNTQ